jgi:hypothetical protein
MPPDPGPLLASLQNQLVAQRVETKREHLCNFLMTHHLRELAQYRYSGNIGNSRVICRQPRALPKDEHRVWLTERVIRQLALDDRALHQIH